MNDLYRFIKNTLKFIPFAIILYIVFILLSSSIDLGAAAYSFSIEFISAKSSILIILCSMFAGWLGCYISLRQFLKEQQ